jgi:translation initiation factor 2 alpha subunit (eIF-2alpha)
MNCRFYKNKFPIKDDYVKVRITSEDIDCHGYHAELLEYNKIEAFMPLSHISKKRRIRSKKQLVDIDKIMFLQVIEVNKEKGYIDLSKKHIDVDLEGQAEIDFDYSQKLLELGYSVYILYRDYLNESNTTYDDEIIKETVITETIWNLYDTFKRGNYKVLYEDILDNIDILWIDYFNETTFDEVFKARCLKSLINRMKVDETCLEYIFSIYCLEEDAVSTLKDILNVVHDKISLTINSPPKYRIISSGIIIEDVKERIENFVEEIKERSKKYNVKTNFTKEIEVFKKGTVQFAKLTNYHLDKPHYLLS